MGVSVAPGIFQKIQWYIPWFWTHPSIPGQCAIDNQTWLGQSPSLTWMCTPPPCWGRTESQCIQIVFRSIWMWIPRIIGHTRWDSATGKEVGSYRQPPTPQNGAQSADICGRDMYTFLHLWQRSHHKTPNLYGRELSKIPSRIWNVSL